MRDTRASTTLPPFLPLPVNILAEPETDAPTLWTGNASRYDVLREQKLAYKQPAGRKRRESFVIERRGRLTWKGNSLL